MKTLGMTERQGTTLIVALTMMMASALPMTAGQKTSPADAAAKLTGSWKLNREMSPQVTDPGRGGGRRGGAPAFAIAGMVPQRGGGRGGSSPDTAADLTPEQRAGQAALRTLQQVAEVITIKATADSVSIADGTGERTYAIDGKNARLVIGEATISEKSRWDKATLRQEFWNPERKLIKAWEVDESGRLVLKVRVESMTLNSSDVKAIFDRQ
ncbi:MAG: hypothetical protein ABI818_02970 [Acidobacteriota bacterium]